MPDWTVGRVKRELPLISVKYNNRSMNAKIVGRKNEMASIVIQGIGSFDFSWKFIVNKLNKNERIEVK